MIPILAISGTSGSGKTVLIERLVAELTRRKWRIATIKHHHGKMDAEKGEKDSQRHKRAGAVAVAFCTSDGTNIVRDETSEPGPVEIAEMYLQGSDMVIAEGYKSARIPKIVLVNKENPESIELARQDMAMAYISADDAGLKDMKRFHPDDISALADYLEERFLKKEQSARIYLMVDGKRVPMKPFVRDLVDEVVRGMVRTFKGTENAGRITIVLDKRNS